MRVYDRTLELLRQTEIPLHKIAVEIGVSPGWLFIVRKNGMADPSHHKVERLYEYLSGRKLEV